MIQLNFEPDNSIKLTANLANDQAQLDYFYSVLDLFYIVKRNNDNPPSIQVADANSQMALHVLELIIHSSFEEITIDDVNLSKFQDDNDRIQVQKLISDYQYLQSHRPPAPGSFMSSFQAAENEMRGTDNNYSLMLFKQALYTEVVKPLTDEQQRLAKKLQNKFNAIKPYEEKTDAQREDEKNNIQRMFVLSESAIKMKMTIGTATTKEACLQIHDTIQNLDKNKDLEKNFKHKWLRRLGNLAALLGTGIIPGAIKYWVTGSLLFSMQGNSMKMAKKAQNNYKKYMDESKRMQGRSAEEDERLRRRLEKKGIFKK